MYSDVQCCTVHVSSTVQCCLVFVQCMSVRNRAFLGMSVVFKTSSESLGLRNYMYRRIIDDF